MARSRAKLTGEFVHTVTSAGKYGDENGLILRVTRSGSKQWIQRLTIHGKRRDLGLGGYPLVSLSEARQMAFVNRKLARTGGDPLATKHSNVPTLEEAATAVFEMLRPPWRNAKHSKEWMASLRRYVFPSLGAKLVDTITTGDVLSVLLPIWKEKYQSARRTRERLGAVMRWAVARGYRADNPAGDVIMSLLPRTNPIQRHHKSLPHQEVEAAIEAVRKSKTATSVKLAFEFQVLTASRPGETRLARWDEFDLKTREWTIPTERTTANHEHRAPLSPRAIQILMEAGEIADGSGIVFPSSRGHALSDQVLSRLLRDLGIQAVPNGFRSSFREWAVEFTTASSAVVEAALVRSSSVDSDLFERHRKLMDAWAEYVAPGNR